jgi:hypothetical protein
MLSADTGYAGGWEDCLSPRLSMSHPKTGNVTPCKTATQPTSLLSSGIGDDVRLSHDEPLAEAKF